MAEQWRNWSGSLRFTPERVEVPEKEQNSGRKGIALMGSMAYGGDSQAAN